MASRRFTSLHLASHHPVGIDLATGRQVRTRARSVNNHWSVPKNSDLREITSNALWAAKHGERRLTNCLVLRVNPTYHRHSWIDWRSSFASRSTWDDCRRIATGVSSPNFDHPILWWPCEIISAETMLLSPEARLDRSTHAISHGSLFVNLTQGMIPLAQDSSTSIVSDLTS